ncbi:epithelial membrane protein 3-like [Styela clava]|uniref:epithelial membrane protein 3-like n=1 Tax=Styela clava TaxID=7725 RepID=UPI0019398177|nr:epithelial membrane protein 3-like [Styela clava]
MGELKEFPFLVGTSGLLVISFIFAVIAVATDGWYDVQSLPFLTEYNSATKTEKEDLLWLVGIVVLILLGIICLCFTAVIIVARFCGHSRGRVKLGGFLSIFTSAVFIVALIIFMLSFPPAETSYGYSFGLMWASIPLSLAGGIIMMLLPDDAFLDSEIVTYSAAGPK